jgi:hypothetical protein
MRRAHRAKPLLYGTAFSFFMQVLYEVEKNRKLSSGFDKWGFFLPNRKRFVILPKKINTE